MAEPMRFSPEELDRIEDALESLEGSSPIDEASPQVRDVLEAYRGILVASREAMPMQDVPAGALAWVFAEAEASVGAAQLAAPVVEPERPGFWTRLRKAFLIPSVALAGTAALVLLMNFATLGDSESGVDTVDSKIAANEEREAPARMPASELAEETRSAAEAVDAKDTPAAAAPPPAPGAVDSLVPAKEQKAGPRGRSLDPLGDVPEPEPEPGLDPAAAADGSAGVDKKAEEKSKNAESESARWDLIERADRAREGGDCAAARQDYSIATEDDDAGVRARAYAGLGLCNLQAGDDAGAEDAFERARSEDGAVEKFIRAERKPTGSYKPAPKQRKKAPPKGTAPTKKSQKKNAINLEEQFDPFSP